MHTRSSFVLIVSIVGAWSCAAVAFASPSFEDEVMNDPGIVEHMLGAQWASVDREIELRDIDKQALDESTKWRSGAGASAPAAGPDGRVIFEFGTTTPRVICAQLHICDIEMQAGELIYDTKAGDDKRWDIVSAGSEATQHVVVKPKAPNLETNLAIYTNRRTYFVELVSSADERKPFMPFIAFSYPEDTKAKWARLRERMTSAPASQAASSRLASQDDPSADYELQVRPNSLHLGYKVEKAGRWLNRRRTKWMPVRVYDDGQKTFIVMPERLQEEPVFVVKDSGQNAVVNLRWKGRVMIVDRLFDKALMMLGAGWYQQRVSITRVEE